jgi:hypothetical protein
MPKLPGIGVNNIVVGDQTITSKRNKKAALKRAAVNKERDLLKSLAIERKYASHYHYCD